MGGLADDWYAYQQMCVDVLCAYVRTPHETNPESSKYREGDREVRRVIVKIIRDNLRRPEPERRWRGLVFSFEGAVFDYGDLSGARFEDGYVSFHRAKFIDRTFYLSRAEFSRTGVSFSEAEFNGAHVSFNEANLRQAREVHFEKAAFRSGTVSFQEADLGAADFSGATRQDAAVVEFSATKYGPSAKLGIFEGIAGTVAVDD
jgi:hypothetical protein